MLYSLYLFARFTITPYKDEEEDSDESDIVTAPPVISRAPRQSSSACDLQMGVASFCKAFPWHFVMDRRLELVQLGAGFMRLFGCVLNRHGTSVATYFEFHRPRGITVSFSEIVKRANTPFVLVLKKPAGVEDFPAVVSKFIYFEVNA